MARNVEIKARVDDPDALARRAANLASSGPQTIDQDDTFFRCACGRLKLRAFSDQAGELIYYLRADARGPKESFYLRVPTSAPAALRELLTVAHGEVGRVRKQRTVYLAGRTRIHLDRVEGLGDFVELEVMLAEGASLDEGVREAQALMAALGVLPQQLVEGAYVDLLAGPAGAPAVTRVDASIRES